MVKSLFADKSFFKNLYCIALPIIIQNLVNSLVNMLDTIMVGQLGSAEIAGVGLGNQVFFLLNMILFGIASGGSIFIAQYWGKKDFAGMKKILGFSFSLGIILSMLFMIAALCFPKNIISFYSKDPKVIALGADYLRVIAISYPITAISFIFSAALRSVEQVKIPMTATIISLTTNAFLNYLFIFGAGPIPSFGVVGAAIATVISRAVEFLYLFFISYKRKLPVAAKLSELLSFNFFIVRKYIVVAFPVIANELLWSFGVTIHSVIFARMSTDAIAAFNIANTISQLTWVFFIGAGNAAAIMLGKKIGENNTELTFSYAKRFIIFMPILATFIGSLLFPLSKLLPYIYKVNPYIVEQAALMLLVLMVTYPLKSINMCVVVGICRSGGDTIFAAIMDVAFLYLLSIPLGFAAVLLWNFPVWLVYAVILSEEILKVIFALWRVKSKKWLHNVT